VKSSAEQEMRAALCDMDKRDYASAQKRLERLLQSDPKNIYAEKLLLGSLAEQIKPGDKSPGNIALIRKAIEGYQQAMNNPQFTSEEKRRIDRFLVALYGKISKEEQRNELQRRAADSNRTAKDRSDLYTVLASQSWNCSFTITDMPANKGATVSAGNRATVFYKKPREQKDFDSAQACVKRGLGEIENAIRLDPDNESAWAYKTNLLLEASKLADMEGNPAQRTSYQKQSAEALQLARELGAKRQAEREKEWARQDEERKKNDSFTPKQVAEYSKDLVEYRRENSLDEAAKRAFMPIDSELTTLVAPVPVPEEKTEPTSTSVSKPSQEGCFREADKSAQVQEKRDWKTFAPAEQDIIVDLPDNVCRSSGGGYIAASDGVTYKIIVMPRPLIALEPPGLNGVLNTLARTFIGIRGGEWLADGLGNSFELKLLRKEDVNGQPLKVYAYTLVSCSQRKEGVLMVHASKAHYYTIEISGAGESDPRVQRFIGSLKFK